MAKAKVQEMKCNLDDCTQTKCPHIGKHVKMASCADQGCERDPKSKCVEVKAKAKKGLLGDAEDPDEYEETKEEEEEKKPAKK